jgi:hypothetical protein
MGSGYGVGVVWCGVRGRREEAFLAYGSWQLFVRVEAAFGLWQLAVFDPRF